MTFPTPFIFQQSYTPQLTFAPFSENLFICQQNITFASDSTDTRIPLRENFKIKIYFGPNFAQWYDILNDKSEGSGYYASNNQAYVSFEEVNQTYNNIAYTGYGYNTTNTLLSPLYTGAPNGEFRIYMCIKYNEGQQFYTEIRPKNLTMNTNTIHHIILAFDVHDLIPIVTEEGGTYSTRSSSSTFQKIDIKPIKVICN